MAGGEAHRVVIVGGGFGGLYAARAMKRLPVEITLVDRRNFHLFQPLLYQVATGGLSPGDIAAPLRAVLQEQQNTRVLLGEVTGIDLAARRVALSDGASLEFDTLVLATGSRHSYFGHDEWEALAPGLKTVEDATEMRSRILSAFEAAELEPDPEKRKAWLTFLIVGGGPTGVELAGALGEIANDTLKGDFRTFRPEEARILLVDASDRLLSSYPPGLSDKAERSLIRLGVRPRTNVMVTGVDGGGVFLKTANGTERIEARTVLWAAGVAASGTGRLLGAPLDRAGRVKVGPDLTVPGHPEVFVIGDLAFFEQDGKPLPGVAPVAMQQGRHVARTIEARLRGRPAPPFRYHDRGSLATIGRASAVADFGWLRFNGYPAWLTWLFVHLLYLVGFQNRLVVLIQWAFQYFTFNRGARLIAGRGAPRSV